MLSSAKKSILFSTSFTAMLAVALFLNPLAASASVADYGETDPTVFTTRPQASAWYEKDDHLGSFVYHVPIVLPPGRGELQPSLELTYNSYEHEERNIAGYGWGLSIPFIERQNKTGVEDLYDGTFFLSSLSGELASISLSDTQHGTYGARVETGPYLSYSYGTDERWTAIDARGTTYTFGSSSASQVVDPSDSTRVYRWMLEEIRDQNDNYVAFNYTSDSNQLYPSRITYTGNGSTDGIFSLSFGYETRSDTNVSYASDFAVTTSQRLSSITVSSESRTVHEYALDYNAGDNGVRSMLASITQTSYAEDGTAVNLSPTTFSYSTSTLSWSENSAYSLPACFSQNEGFDCGSRIADVNGDALPDILFANGDTTSTASVYRNDGDGTGWTVDTSYSIPVRFLSSIVSADQGLVLFDVNGDLVDDLVHGESDDIYDGDSADDRDVYINNDDGTGWTLNTSYSLPTNFARNSEPYSMGDYFVRIGDVNGDGLSDLVQASSAYSTFDVVYINQGDGSGWAEDTSFSITGSFYSAFGGDYRDGGARFADVNNDGLVDVVQGLMNSGLSTAVYINDGDGTSSVSSSYSVPSHFSYGGFDGGARLADANGDGLIDVLVADDVYGTNAIYLNNGDGSGWTLASGSLPTNFNLYNLGSQPYDTGARLMDINGDGLIDIARYDNTRSTGDRVVYTHDGDVPDLLTSITTSLGGEIAISYTASSASGENPDLPFTMQVVESIATSDGLGGSSTVTYNYADGSYYFADAEDRKFAGFGTVTEMDALGNQTITYMHQGNGDDSASSESGDDASKIGMRYRVERYDSSSALYEIVITNWENTDLGNDRDFVAVESELVLRYDGGSSHLDTATGYTYDSMTGTTLTNVEYGEVTGSTDGSFTDTGSDDRTTTYTYATDASDEIRSAVVSETLTDGTGAAVSQTLYTYDHLSSGEVATGNVTAQEAWISGSDYATTNFTYDVYGNVLTQTDPLGHVTTYVYETNNLYPETITNALGHTQTFAYDLAAGKETTIEEANGTVTETDYDGLGRSVEERRSSTSDATTLVTTKTWSYWDDTSYYPDAPRSVKVREYLSETMYKESLQYIDGLDRIVETKIFDDEGTGYSETETTYDALGRVSSSSLAESSADWTYDAGTVSSDLSETYAYDALDRVTMVTNTLGTTETTYDGFTKTVTDALGNEKRYETDGLGRLIELVELLDGTAYSTMYEWNAADKLTSITDAFGNVRAFTYDGRGLRLTAEDLHEVSDSTYGTWTYTYDDAGNLETSLSPNSVTVTYAYDELNRQTQEDADDVSGVEVSSAYDSCTGGTGKLCEAAVNGGATTTYTYDGAGNPASEAVTIDSTSYVTNYTYDYARNVLTTTHPDGSVVTNTYNTLGKIETVDGIVTDMDYGPNGEVTSQTNADGTVATYTYDETQRYRLTRKTTTGYTQETTSSTTTTTTTTTFYPTAGDGLVYNTNASWDTAHDATTGSTSTYTSTMPLVGTGRSTTSYSIYRAFLPFDTSSIPDDATITSATLNMYVYSKTNQDNDGDDWVTVVQGSQPSTTTLTTADYDLAGSVNSPTEGVDTSERKDITNVSTGAYLSFNLNSAGLDWLSKTDATKLALREGHDVMDSAFTSSSTTSSQYNYLSFRASEYAGTTYDPYLSVTYMQTSTSSGSIPVAATLQDLSYTYDGVGNITQIIDASDTDSAKTTSYTYDDLYRLMSSTVSGSADGNDGTISYAYDAIGNITSRSDVGTYTYDGTDYANPHAVTSIAKTDGTTATYTYDNNGNLTSDGTKSYTWDYKNRLTSSSEHTTTTTTTTSTGSLTFYPSAGDGYAYKSHSSWDTAHDSTSGSANATLQYFMTGTAKSTTSYFIYRAFLPFDTSALPDDATVTGATLSVYPYSKTNNDDDGDDWITVVQGSQASSTTLSGADFDAAGSINSPTEGIDSSGRKDITSVATGAYTSFTLNETGRGWVSLTGTTGLALREGHDVIDSAFTSSSATSTTYDRLLFRSSEYSGTTRDPYLAVTYTYPSTTTTTTTVETTYTYDHAMRRVSKSSSSGTTYYPSAVYSVTDGTSTVYVSGPSGLVASIENDGTTTTTQTIHTDHLGSTSVVTDEDGVMIELLDYNPYGTERISWSSSSADGEAESQKTYIGEYSDDESGLSYLNARYYDPERGQFLSQDAVYLAMGSGKDRREQVAWLDLQLQNSYSYARNNPVTLQDKDGEFIPLVIGAVWLAFEVGSTAYDIYTTADAWMDPNGSSWDRWSAIGGLAIGAVLPGGGYGKIASKADDVVDGVRHMADFRNVMTKTLDDLTSAGDGVLKPTQDYLDPKTVQKYYDVLKAGGSVDPVEVMDNKGIKYILDGHHRYIAGKMAGVEVPTVNVGSGDLKGTDWNKVKSGE